jgi:hypothetical protein
LPDWIDVNLLQTVLLFGATLLAFLAYRAEREARKDAAIERRLELVASRISELAAAGAESRERPGLGPALTAAYRNLRSATELSPINLPKSAALGDAFDEAAVDAALAEVRAELKRLSD